MSRSMTIFLLAASLSLGALTPGGAAFAQSQPQPPPAEDTPAAMAREAIEKLMRALSLAIQNLPQYALPELNERGDIIIRRINPRAETPKRAPDFPDGTRT